MIVIQSPRLQLSQFQMTDAQGFWMHHARHRQIHAVGAAIVERVRDAMREETAGTTTEQVFFRHSAARQQGMPWYGLVGRRGFCFARTRTLAQGKRTRAGFWPEVVAALVEWGHATLGKGSFVYPAAVQNAASRRIAGNLHGEIIGNRTNPKYDSVVYRIRGVASMKPHESAFVESFILKPRRERALELLASSKNRHKFTSKFDHHGRDYIIPKCIRPIEPRHQHPPPIADMLRAMGAPETCHVIGGERDVYLEATRRLLAKYRHYTH